MNLCRAVDFGFDTSPLSLPTMVQLIDKKKFIEQLNKFIY